MKPVPGDKNWAEALALKALTHIIPETALCQSFLSVTGLAPGQLAELASDPHFLAGVLDFLLADEAVLLTFCDVEGITPASPAYARRLLPGGDETEWT